VSTDLWGGVYVSSGDHSLVDICRDFLLERSENQHTIKKHADGDITYNIH
jgi:hypothetical protein